MTVVQATLAFSNLKGSVGKEIEEFHVLARLIVFARESATNLAAEPTVYCLDLALAQIATELHHRADNSSDIPSCLQDETRRSIVHGCF
jgi:hypothetical protein